jgi:hypothetical protein
MAHCLNLSFPEMQSGAGFRTDATKGASLVRLRNRIHSGAEPRNTPRSVVNVRTIDVDVADRYLAGIEALTREARTSRNLRVKSDALALLAAQAPNVSLVLEEGGL